MCLLDILYLPWRNVYLGPISIFLIGFFVYVCVLCSVVWGSLCILNIDPSIEYIICKYISPFNSLPVGLFLCFIFLCKIVLVWYSLFVYFWLCCVCQIRYIQENIATIDVKVSTYCLSFLLGVLWFLLLHLSLNPLWVISVYGIRKWSHVIFLFGSVQFFQHHLSKKLSFPHCTFLPPLLTI